MIVALNKIDTPQATDENIRKIYGQLAEHGLNPTEWGGDTEIIKTSAINGTGITELLEVLDYQAELLELTADYGGPARGTVIEAEMQTGRGSVARVLVQDGADQGRRLHRLGPSVWPGPRHDQRPRRPGHATPAPPRRWNSRASTRFPTPATSSS